jgi:photosystem II stability/assembly factor-like uncharacterized protein
MNKLNYYILSIIVFSFQAYNIALTQENETGEEIEAREQFINMKRAGGLGKIIQPDAYSNAIRQMRNIIQDKNLTGSLTGSTSWISANPTGMFYSRTNANYIAGRTNSFAFHPTDANIIYIAAAGGGVWKTTNAGLNWTPLTDNLPTLYGGDVTLDPNNPNIVYWATGEQNYSADSHYGDGIYKSTNAGVNWVQIATSSIGTRFSDIVVDPSNSNIVYAAGSGGVYKSLNAGINWTSLGTAGSVNCLLIVPSNSQILYMSAGGTSAGKIYKSTDAGLSWFQLINGLPVSGIGRIQLAMSPTNSNYIYASAAASSGGALLGLYRTTNGGDNWTLQTSTPNYMSSQGWYDNAVTVSPLNPDFVVVAGLDVYYSINGGVTLTKVSNWSTSVSTQMSHADIHTLAYNGNVLYCGSDGGVYRSSNEGTTWSDLNRTISTLQFQSADYDPSAVEKLYGGCQDNNKQTSTNSGADWNQRTTGDGGYTIVDPVNTNYIYGQYVQGSIQRSANSGVSFSEIKPSGSTAALFYNPFEMAPGDHNTMIYGGNDVWKTTSVQTVTTSTWTQIANSTVTGGNVSAIGISYTNTGKIYIGTSNGRILVTTDNGANWTLTAGYPYVSDFAVDKNDDNICYASFTGTSTSHVYKTTNAGINWTNITNNLPSIAANSLILRTTTPRMLFTGTDLGVYYTTNDGAQWISFNNGLPTLAVLDMKYKEPANILMAATHGRGCWLFNLNSIILNINTLSNTAEKYKLEQNYPNPFNPETNIKFSIPRSEFVMLTIYNSAGIEVSTLLSRNMSAGEYEVNWNAGSMASGVYYYKLSASDFSETKRMMLVK